MAHNELIKGVCPKCGEMLEIPGHLKQFSCGARLSPAEILAELAGSAAAPAVDGETAYRFYCDHILEAIVNYPGIERQLTKGEFDPAFQRYSSGIGETFRMLNAAVSAGTAAEDQAAVEFLDQLETHWRSLSKWSLPINRTGIVETDKFVIAIFLVPAVRRMALPCSETFCVALREEWARRHPKSPFNLGDYDSIVAGFRKKYFGLCFITTAVCRGTSKANDCEELCAFRNFRDGYLRSCPDGPALMSTTTSPPGSSFGWTSPPTGTAGTRISGRSICSPATVTFRPAAWPSARSGTWKWSGRWNRNFSTESTRPAAKGSGVFDSRLYGKNGRPALSGARAAQTPPREKGGGAVYGTGVRPRGLWAPRQELPRWGPPPPEPLRGLPRGRPLRLRYPYLRGRA